MFTVPNLFGAWQRAPYDDDEDPNDDNGGMMMDHHRRMATPPPHADDDNLNGNDPHPQHQWQA